MGGWLKAHKNASTLSMSSVKLVTELPLLMVLHCLASALCSDHTNDDQVHLMGYLSHATVDKPGIKITVEF